MNFETTVQFHFDEADPAGIVFSGHVFTKAHRCYEQFVAALGESPQSFFLSPTLLFPLRHYEVEFLGPLKPLQSYRVSIEVDRLSDSSFVLQFQFLDEKRLLAKVTSTHVCVDKIRFQKTPIPTGLKENLKKFARPESL